MGDFAFGDGGRTGGSFEEERRRGVFLGTEVYVDDFPHGLFKSEGKHEGSGKEVVGGLGVVVVVHNLEVDKAERHFQFDGEFDVAEKEVEADTGCIAKVDWI